MYQYYSQEYSYYRVCYDSSTSTIIIDNNSTMIVLVLYALNE